MQSRPLRLAHHWTLRCDPGVPVSLVRDFIRPAVRAVPSSLARRLGSCRIWLLAELEDDAASTWAISRRSLDIQVATADVDEHDVAMELLLCLGQALWGRLPDTQLRHYWTVLCHEVGRGIEAEIDEQALEAKRAVFSKRSSRERWRRIVDWGEASFAGTAAEYVHCLWHDVSVRRGPEYLPASDLRRRLELMALWFPADRGYRLFPPERKGTA